MTSDEITMLKNYEYFLAALKQKVKTAQDDKGDKINQSVIAEKVGITHVHLSGVVNRKRNASDQLQEKLCDYFGMTRDEFIESGKTILGDDIIVPPEVIKSEPPQNLERRRSANTDLVAHASSVINELATAYSEIERLTNILLSLDESIMIVDKDGLIIFQNRKCLGWFGNFVGRSYLEMIDETNTEFVEGEKSAVTSCFESHRPEKSISWAGKKCISGTATPTFDTTGNIFQIVFVAKDVTQRQEALMHNKELALISQLALEKMNRAVTIYDKDLKILFSNDKMKEITGATDADLVDIATFRNYLVNSGVLVNHEEVFTIADKARSEGKKVEIETFKNDGSSWLYTMEPIETQGNFRGYITTVTPLDK